MFLTTFIPHTDLFVHCSYMVLSNISTSVTFLGQGHLYGVFYNLE